jgi:hydroxymethylbilane synthase
MKKPARDVPPYVVAFDLLDRPVVIVGGGRIAERKLRGVLEAGARVTIVAPRIASGLRALAKSAPVALVERAFAPGDLAGATLAFATTDDDAVNASVVAAARACGVPVDDASEGGRGDFTTAASHRVGRLTFSVDTAGAAPAFARRLRDELRGHFDERYARAADTLALARRQAAIVLPPERRAALMSALAARPIGDLAAMSVKDVEHAVEDAGATARETPSGDEGFVQVVCATRGSALALHQARIAIAKLAARGVVSTILTVTTAGDRDRERPLDALGSENVFIKELEQALRDGRADYAVHSCKDLPGTLPADMHLAAIGPREDARDVLCSERYASLDALPPGARVGTSSPRRSALLAALRPDLEFALIRGNVDTRLRKLRDGEYDAIVLAAAGLARLGLRATHNVPLDPEIVVPAVGQGALAIEVRAADVELAARIHAAFADPASELAVEAERAFLRTVGGGCSAPIGAYATVTGTRLHLRAAIAQRDGSQIVRGETGAEVAGRAEAEALGAALAQRLLAEAGDALPDASRSPEKAPRR